MFSNVNKLDEQTRRLFMANVAKATFGVSFLPIFAQGAFAATPTPVPAKETADDRYHERRSKPAKHLIYLYMSGGMSHIDTLDPKPGSSSQGPFKAINSAADGIQMGEHLPLLAKQMKHGAIIRSLNSNVGAHEQASYYMRTSFAARNTVRHPSMAAWLNYFQSTGKESLPGGIMVNGGGQHPLSGFLESKFAPLPIGDPKAGLKNSAPPAGIDMKEMGNRIDVLSQLNKQFYSKFHQKAMRAHQDMYTDAVKLMSSKDLEAFDITKEPEDIKKSYGDNAFGEGCLLARRLLEKGVRCVDITLGGWDTHDDNFDKLEEKLPILDQGFSALVSDLEKKGMLNDTLICLTGDFGRSPHINNTNGRDHYPKAFSSLLMGGGLKGGMAYGKTNADGTEVAEGKIGVPDLNATIAYGLGLALDKVVTSPDGRPFTVADKGKPLAELFKA